MKRNTAFVLGLVTFQAMLAVAVVAKPETLGLPAVVLNWMAILSVGVSVLLNQLERIGDNPQQVETVETVVKTAGRPAVVETVTTTTETLPKSEDSKP